MPFQLRSGCNLNSTPLLRPELSGRPDRIHQKEFTKKNAGGKLRLASGSAIGIQSAAVCAAPALARDSAAIKVNGATKRMSCQPRPRAQ